MFHLSTEMKIQLLCFAALVVVCVAGTRLIYHDGIVGDVRRLKWHCQMQAALILILCGWAGSIGFRINESCVAIIEQQSETINKLQAVRGSSVNSHTVSHVVLTTPSGTKIEEESNGVRIIGGRRSSSSGRIHSIGRGERSGATIHGVPGNGTLWNRGNEVVASSGMLGEPAESRASRNIDDTYEEAKRYLQAVLGMDRRTPIKTPELSDIR